MTTGVVRNPGPASSALRLLPLRLVAVRAGSRLLQKFLFLGDKSRVLLLNLFENLLAFR